MTLVALPPDGSTWKGWDGALRLDGDVLWLTRSSPGKARGKGSEDRRIPLGSITGVGFVPATRLLEGGLGLGLGGTEPATTRNQMLADANAVSFSRKHQTDFTSLHAFLKEVAEGNARSAAVTTDSFDPPHADRERRRAERDAKRQEKQRREAQDRLTYGDVALSANFGLRQITLYDKGYVRVASALRGSVAAVERLVAIQASSEVSKKSGVGRGAGAVLTGGLNLLGSNKRGDVYLTIVTATTTHVLHEDPPTASNIKIAKRIEATGQAIVARVERGWQDGPSRGESGPPSESNPAVAPTVRDRLDELQALLDARLINEADYAAKKASLLEEL